MKQFRVVLFLGLSSHLVAQILVTDPKEIVFPNNNQQNTVSVVEGNATHVEFKYSGLLPILPTAGNIPDFFVLAPAIGTTPVLLQVGLNPSVVAQLQPGGLYEVAPNFTIDGQTSVSVSGPIIQLTVPSEPPPTIQSVVNSASLQPVLSPGALVSIFGTHLTGPTLTTTFDDTASYPTSVASTSVMFNGVAAPLLYVSPMQINAIVPFSLAGQTSVQVIVQRFTTVSAAVTVPLQDTAPAVFTAAQNGAGQAVVLQQAADGSFSYNSSTNPAPAGAALEMFANGQGVWTPPALSDIFVFPERFSTQPVSVTIGGQPAKITYVGGLGAPLSSWSVLQINATMPSGLTPGAQPMVVAIGSHDSSQQSVLLWTR